MPIECALQIKPLTTEEFRGLDFQVMRHAFESQNDLGRLADERIYQADLTSRLRKENLDAIGQVEIKLSYADFVKRCLIDLVVAETGVYELKVAKSISDTHVGQLLNYLYLLGIPRGKIINFGGVKVESRFVNAPISAEHRLNFRLDDSTYHGDAHFKEISLGILRDWGTSLTLSFYVEAIAFHLNKLFSVEAMLPLRREGVFLGNQSFLLASPDAAFKLTAFGKEMNSYQEQIKRLIKYSSLRAIHWLNIHHEVVALKTILRED